MASLLAGVKYGKYAHLVPDVVTNEFYECFSFQLTSEQALFELSLKFEREPAGLGQGRIQLLS